MTWSLSVERTVRFVKMQVKVQNLCPPSSLPNQSKGADWSKAPGPYI